MDRSGKALAQRIAEEFPSAAQLTREDLQELADTPKDAISSEKQAEFIDALVFEDAEVRALYDEHLQLLRVVEDAAARNIELRPELEYARQQTREAFGEACAVEATWQVVERELNEEYKRFTPSALQMQLKLALDQSHEESEVLANEYVERSSTSEVTTDSLSNSAPQIVSIGTRSRYPFDHVGTRPLMAHVYSLAAAGPDLVQLVR